MTLQAEIPMPSAEQKRARLLRLIEEQQRADVSPTSHGQEALWFLQQQSPDNVAYNVAACLEIEGSIDPDRLRQAMRCVVDRHPTLRSRFQMHASPPATAGGQAYGRERPGSLRMDAARPD